MAKELQSASIAAPGFYGLNLQESSVTLAAGFALQADNCIIDKYGRLGARKGWQYITSGSDGVDLRGVHEFIDIDGNRYLGAWNDTSFYISNGSTLTTVPYSGLNTITDDGWQAATLNDAAYLFNKNYEPIYFSPSTGTLADLVSVGHGVVPKGNTVLSAYGRLWTADTATNTSTVYWSTLLDGANFASGTAGSLDLAAVLVNGNDDIVALGAHSGRLIIFCRNNIVIYGDTDGDKILNPATMRLVEVISGVGCIARDSVQNTGNDIIFLSDTGLMSLGRLIQEKAQPMLNLSKNIRDDLVTAVAQSDKTKIKSAYSANDAFYLLLLPEFKRVYCFDMRMPLQDGSARVTVWDNQTHSSIHNTLTHGLVFTNANGIAKYAGYSDNGQDYVMKYFTNYFDFGDSTKLKMLKRIGTTVIGGSGQAFTIKAGFDYSDSYRPYPVALDNLVNYEYGEAEYGLAEYTIGTLVDQVRAPLGGGGNVIQVGLEATINGSALSIQRLDIYIKEGRIY